MQVSLLKRQIASDTMKTKAEPLGEARLLPACFKGVAPEVLSEYLKGWDSLWKYGRKKRLYYYCKNGRRWNRAYQVTEGRYNFYGWYGLGGIIQKGPEHEKSNVNEAGDKIIIASEKPLEAYELVGICFLEHGYISIILHEEVMQNLDHGVAQEMHAHAQEAFDHHHGKGHQEHDHHEEVGAGWHGSTFDSHLMFHQIAGMAHDPLHAYHQRIHEEDHRAKKTHHGHHHESHVKYQENHHDDEGYHGHAHKYFHAHHEGRHTAIHLEEENESHHIWHGMLNLLAGMGHDILHMFRSHGKNEHLGSHHANHVEGYRETSHENSGHHQAREGHTRHLQHESEHVDHGNHEHETKGEHQRSEEIAVHGPYMRIVHSPELKERVGEEIIEEPYGQHHDIAHPEHSKNARGHPETAKTANETAHVAGIGSKITSKKPKLYVVNAAYPPEE